MTRLAFFGSCEGYTWHSNFPELVLKLVKGSARGVYEFDDGRAGGDKVGSACCSANRTPG